MISSHERTGSPSRRGSKRRWFVEKKMTAPRAARLPGGAALDVHALGRDAQRGRHGLGHPGEPRGPGLGPLVLRDHEVPRVPVHHGPDLGDVPVVQAEGLDALAGKAPPQVREALAHAVREHLGLAGDLGLVILPHPRPRSRDDTARIPGTAPWKTGTARGSSPDFHSPNFHYTRADLCDGGSPMRRMVVAWLALAVAEATAAPSDVLVRVYADGNASSLTDLVQGLDGKDGPLPGVPVDLFGGGELFQISTDWDGRARFEGLPDGLFLLQPRVEGDPQCTSRNTAARLAGLLAAGIGRVVYVALGDSTPVYGAAQPYPERLGAMLKSFFPEAETRNLAHVGSTTWDWLPGHWAFEGARSAIAEADLITVSLGGNDLQALAGLDFTDLTAALEAAKQMIEQTLDNVALIVAAIREIAPQADIVWTVYPNYARSKKWLEYVPPTYLGVLQSGFEIAIGMMREGLAENPGLLIADVAEEWADEDIEPYMYDPIHVNDVGAESYAGVVFRTLGGVLLPEDAGRERLFGYAMTPPVLDAGAADLVTEGGPDAAGDPGGPEDAGADTGNEATVETAQADAGTPEARAEDAATDLATSPEAQAESFADGAASASDAANSEVGPSRGGSTGGGCRATGVPMGWPAWFLPFLPYGICRRRP